MRSASTSSASPTVTDAAGKKVKVNLTPGLEAVGWRGRGSRAGSGRRSGSARAQRAEPAGHPHRHRPERHGASDGSGRQNGAIEQVGADAPVLDKTGQSLTPDKPVKPAKGK
jgi:hypothetical protein